MGDPLVLRVGLLNFSKGVLSEHLLGRVDVAAYQAGLKRGENIIVLKQGGFTIRPGFKWVSDCLGPDERVFPFQFSDEQPYALAFGQEYVQPMTAGGVVTEEELAIVGATSADPVVLEVAFHAFEAGDMVFIDGVAGAMGAFLNGRSWTVVEAVDDNHFSIDADGSAVGAFTSAENGATRTEAPDPPPAPPPTPPPYEPPEPPTVVGAEGAYAGGSGTPWWRDPLTVPARS